MPQPERIIDAHHHLWDLSADQQYPWLMEKGVVRFFGDPASIQCDYQVENFRKDIGSLPVVGSVHIQVGVAAHDEIKETQWLEKQCEANSLPNAIVAFCDLTAPDLEATLDAHQTATALRGIRQIVGRSAEEDATTGSGGLLADPAFVSGLKLLAERGLSFDLQLIPAQMERVAKVLAKVPELNVALCHAGSLSDFTPEGRALWAQGIHRLAELPNLICKLSGFGMFDKRWTAQSMKEQFETVLAAFGPDRMAFGSNFPVDKLAMSYNEVWQRYFDLLEDFGAKERASMFNDVAERFYRISLFR